jgi:hypothetical protein
VKLKLKLKKRSAPKKFNGAVFSSSLSGWEKDWVKLIDNFQPLDLTAGLESSVGGDYCWSPNGQSVAYTARPTYPKDQKSRIAWETNTNIYLISRIPGIGDYQIKEPHQRHTATLSDDTVKIQIQPVVEHQSLTSDNAGFDSSPSFSPCGRYLAWLSMQRGGYESDKNTIKILDFQEKQEKEDKLKIRDITRIGIGLSIQ